MTPTHVFSSEYCEIFKNTYFEEHLQTAISVLSPLNKLLSIEYTSMEEFSVDMLQFWFDWKKIDEKACALYVAPDIFQRNV